MRRMLKKGFEAAPIALRYISLSKYEDTGLTPDEIEYLQKENAELEEEHSHVNRICDRYEKLTNELLAELRAYKQAEAERENPQPLKPEQLKELVDCPYWHKSLIGNEDKWNILQAHVAQNPEDYCYGEYWLAYRYKPKEEEK